MSRDPGLVSLPLGSRMRSNGPRVRGHTVAQSHGEVRLLAYQLVYHRANHAQPCCRDALEAVQLYHGNDNGYTLPQLLVSTLITISWVASGACSDALVSSVALEASWAYVPPCQLGLANIRNTEAELGQPWAGSPHTKGRPFSVPHPRAGQGCWHFTNGLGWNTSVLIGDKSSDNRPRVSLPPSTAFGVIDVTSNCATAASL